MTQTGRCITRRPFEQKGNGMDKFTLNVYAKTGEVVKTCEAQAVEIEFGTVRAIMELLKVESIDDTGALLKVIYNAWDELIAVLGQCFPEMDYEDWSHVRVKELIPLIVEILKYSIGEILLIPKDGKN